VVGVTTPGVPLEVDPAAAELMAPWAGEQLRTHTMITTIAGLC
jgi:hypothetical protein